MDATNQRSAQGAIGLQRKYVVSKELYQLETERIFNSSWICLTRESALDNESGIIPIEFEAHQLILVRSDDGSIKALRNFCRHRGSKLVTNENCTEIGTRIQCPYHAWTYDRSGKLVSAPNMDSVADFDSNRFGLKEVACESFGGFVWINFNPADSLQDFLQPLATQFADWSIAELVSVGELNYEVRANWKLIFQNYNECYHCPVVHPILNRLTPYKDATNLLESGPILGGPMKLADDCETMSVDGQGIAGVLPNLDDEQKRCVNYFTIFPTMFLSTHPDYVLIHRLERIAVDATTVNCQFLVHPESTQETDFNPSPAIEFWDMTNRQDWEVCELAQAGMQDPGYTPGPYSDLESVLAAFDQHYFERMQSGAV